MLLLRHYTARRSQLLLWSCIGFFGLAVNNVMLFVDLSVLPRIDLSVARALVGALAVLVLVYGLIWEAEG